MIIIFTRTILVYLLLILSSRLMGKRQIGQLEVTDFVTTVLISEIACLPIENPDIPIFSAVIPLVTLTTFEIVSSTILCKNPKLKNILSSRPGYLIENGKINQKELIKNRISIDELISEIRQNNIFDISEVEYAIIEQNSKLTIIPKPEYRMPCFEDFEIEPNPKGLMHIVIENGIINEHSLKVLNKSSAWLLEILSERKCNPKDVFLMTINETGNSNIIMKEK